MTVKELIEILEKVKVNEQGQDVEVFIRDNDGDYSSLEEDSVLIDSDNDVVLEGKW